MLDRLHKSIDKSRPCVSAWVGLRDPQFIGAIADHGFDAVTFDMQHGFHDEASILDGVSIVANAGKSPLLRIPTGRWDLVERSLDFGALGVIAPMINTKADAERFAASMKYPPLGARSFGPRHAFNLYKADQKEYLAQYNKVSLGLAMIETREAYDNLDDILSVEALDGVFMGPSDFSISITGKAAPDAYGEATLPLIEDLVKRTKAVGKKLGCFVYGPEHCNLVAKMGFDIICMGLDGTYISKGVDWHLDNLDF